MKLVICEKNISAKRIAYILSGGKSKSSRLGSTPIYDFSKDNDNWRVIGLKGHIVNLDFPHGFNKWHQTKPIDLINVQPCKKISQKGIASSLKTLADKNPYLIVATDFDREGELIGVEVIDLLKQYNNRIGEPKRAKFSAITGYEIKTAFDNLKNVDYNLSYAGETRQIIDLIWGAVLTRYISLTSNRLGKDFLSIGRVQSPTLAILVEREKEIKNFVPKPYWKIISTQKKGKNFNATHEKGQIWEEKVADDIFNKVKSAKTAKVLKIDKKMNKEYPPSPFNTTSFLESASYLRISTAKAMSIAEELYMSGLISYPRTDNTVYPGSLNIKRILEKLATSDFSKEAKEVMNNGRKIPTRGKKKATDHPPIHPVNTPGTKKLLGDQKKIYELIVRRFLATLAKDAISESVDVKLEIKDEKFLTKGYRMIEANWRDIYTYFKEKRKPLPDLIEGEQLEVTNLTLKKDETKPPKRYTQGSLITKMEQLSLGTKSTRHEIINKLYSRKYITLSPLAPTPMAIAVIEALQDYDVVKPKMTAKLEKDMDEISEGKKSLEKTVKESREMLHQVMNQLEKDEEKIKTNIKQAQKEQNTIGKCPKCGKNMLVRTSKKGKRFVGCSGFPDCKNTYSLPQSGGVIATGQTCGKCQSPMVKIVSKGKKPWLLCLGSECSTKNSSK